MEAYSPYGGGAQRLLRSYGLRPRKGLGQNFLIDETVAVKIAEVAAEAAPKQAAGRKAERNEAASSCLEIGPGLGALTLPLLQRFPAVTAVEVDRGLAALLRAELGKRYPSFRLVEGDALREPLETLVEEGENGVVCGNLPYSITGPLTARLLQGLPSVSRFLLMLQAEVVDRMLAGPGDSAYGAFSVLVRAYCEGVRLLDIGPAAFYPRPKVRSSVVQLVRRSVRPWPGEAAPEELVRIARVAFQQRRKQLANALSPLAGGDRKRALEALERAGIHPERRAEQLDLADFAKLAAELPDTGGAGIHHRSISMDEV